jgi:hypothetical protein
MNCWLFEILHLSVLLLIYLFIIYWNPQTLSFSKLFCMKFARFEIH